MCLSTRPRPREQTLNLHPGRSPKRWPGTRQFSSARLPHGALRRGRLSPASAADLAAARRSDYPSPGRNPLDIEIVPSPRVPARDRHDRDITEDWLTGLLVRLWMNSAKSSDRLLSLCTPEIDIIRICVI